MTTAHRKWMRLVAGASLLLVVLIVVTEIFILGPSSSDISSLIHQTTSIRSARPPRHHPDPQEELDLPRRTIPPAYHVDSRCPQLKWKNHHRASWLRIFYPSNDADERYPLQRIPSSSYADQNDVEKLTWIVTELKRRQELVACLQFYAIPSVLSFLNLALSFLLSLEANAKLSGTLRRV